MASRRVCSLAAVWLVGLASVTSAAAMAPKQLYMELLTTPYRSTPNGFHDAKLKKAPLDARTKRLYHAVGAAQVTSSDDEAGVLYVVFPTKPDALRFSEDRTYGTSGDTKVVRVSKLRKVPGYAIPRYWQDLTIERTDPFSGKKVRVGLTVMSAVEQNVAVGASTWSFETEYSGDVPATIRLLASGLTHLAEVRRG